MVDYCHTENCLQQFIVQYFGEPDAPDMWTMWQLYRFNEKVQDVTKEVQMVLSCVIRMGQRFGKTMTAQVLTGSRNKKVSNLDLTNYQLMAY